MRKFFVWLGVLAWATSALAADVFEVAPTALENGPIAPEIVSDGPGFALRFAATADDAAAAEVRNHSFDFSKGVKIELEFMDDAAQSNPFPRLLEAGSLSLHFACDAKTPGDKVLKALLLGPVKGQLQQTLVPVAYRAGVWHKVVYTFSPASRMASLRVDDGDAVVERIPFAAAPTNQNVILGATKLAKSNRGYSGLLRNLRITTPYESAAGASASAIQEIRPPSVNGVPVRHVTVSALKARHLAFPGITRLPNGTLAAVFREGEAHVCPYGRICVTYSSDGGQNWSAPISIADTASDERDPSIQALPDGRILVTHGGWNSWMSEAGLAAHYASETAYITQQGADKFGGSHYLFSADNGQSWSQPIKVPAFNPHGPAIKDGYFYQPTLANENGKRQVYMYRGSPDGKTWEKRGLVGESQSGNVAVREVFEEPHTAALADGTLVTAIRVPSDGYMRISTSKDDGRTWTSPMKTPVRGFPQHLLPLKDGRLLATYGYRYYPMGVRACISRDGGATWDMDKEMVLQNNGAHGDLGYPVSIELGDGAVMSVYYHVTDDKPSCFIEAAFYRP